MRRMDQYIALEPEWLFEHSSENAIVDPDNLLIQLAHIRAAAAELPLTLDDGALFPDLGETIPVLMKVDEVRNMGGRFAWSGGLYPAGEFSLRNIDQNKYQLINKETGKNITEMDEEQAFHLRDPFYAEWANMQENRTGISNVLSTYVFLPVDFRFAILTDTEKPEDMLKREKMMRRYHTLKKDETYGTE